MKLLHRQFDFATFVVTWFNSGLSLSITPRHAFERTNGTPVPRYDPCPWAVPVGPCTTGTPTVTAGALWSRVTPNALGRF
ncbi:hypothetical protein AB0O47_19340 [Streptomyces noursei]|uniref:hypothetical protein n=1 Tax=Streptomyces noursei TaxID=1971 RepID=UPI00344F180A